ncbi:ribosome 60S biogenesis N-terminal-domain-containing protein [Panaeolus papilionaceus]|nr:ribosome 60S biogenesis N-terminal-domain-containing protein [Panaeolus papilionaceus]
MPVKNTTGPPPAKRARVEKTTKKSIQFKDPAQIRNALGTDNSDVLNEALSSLRNQLTVHTQEDVISPQDSRLELAKQWMSSSLGAQELFDAWDNANPRQSTSQTLVLAILSALLTLLSAHYSDYALGQPIIKTLLSPTRLRQLNSYIGGTNNELILVTLKLYNVISNFAGGRERKAVLEGFAWEIKSLPKLLSMRRKTQGGIDRTDPLQRPDIRTLYILLLLSFVDSNSASQVKTAFLEQHRDSFLAIFKGLMQDHYNMARSILEVCWTGIWSDVKVKRTIKIGLFNETTLGHLIKLYDKIQPEDEDGENIPANLVHHFLLGICTRPGFGICFKDNGWYPRETDSDEMGGRRDEDEENKKKGGKIYNKILANILKTLKVNEDARQQELATKILAACPELVAGYWPAAALTLEPRLSSKWIANIAFFGNILSLPIPVTSFYLPGTRHYNPTPPPLQNIIENILPSVNTKNNFSKGLQSTSGLVQHCTAIALSKCLLKYISVVQQITEIVSTLEEDHENGQWTKRLRELEREVRRRVPEFQVVVAFSQQKHGATATTPAHPTKTALLTESAQRVLWLYHKCLPAVVAEARFDIAKLLQGITQGEEETPEDDPDAAARLYRIQQLHILSLLKDSDQFVWSGKIGSLPNTPFHILLTSYTSATIPSIGQTFANLLHHILSQCILFQEDRTEPHHWLNALPLNRSISPQLLSDQISLNGETTPLITFLDDCVQRCLKTPYRYIESLHEFAVSSHPSKDQVDRLDMLPSPLIMTFAEQLEAKVNNKTLSLIDVMSMAGYLRKLMFYLTGKTSSLHFLRAFARKVDEMLSELKLISMEGEESLVQVIRSQVAMTHRLLAFVPKPLVHQTSDEFLKVLAEVDALETESSDHTVLASELIDYVRVHGGAIGSEGVQHLIQTLQNLSPGSLNTLLEELDPQESADFTSITFTHARFTWLYTHLSHQLSQQQTQDILLSGLFSSQKSAGDISHAIRIVLHGLDSSRQQTEVFNGHLGLISKILARARSVVDSVAFNALTEMVLLEEGGLKEFLFAPVNADLVDDVKVLLGSCLDASSSRDRWIVRDISTYWLNVLKESKRSQVQSQISTACLWIKYNESPQLFELLGIFSQSTALSSSGITIITSVLESLKLRTSSEVEAEAILSQRLAELLKLRSLLPDPTLLDEVASIAVDTCLPYGLDGSFSVQSSEPPPLDTVIKRSKARWSQRSQSKILSQIDVVQFLKEGSLTAATTKIVAGLIYHHLAPLSLVWDWLDGDRAVKEDDAHLVPILYVLVDSAVERGTADELFSDAVWERFTPRLVAVVKSTEASDALNIRARHIISKVLQRGGSSALAGRVGKELERSSTVTLGVLSLSVELARWMSSKAKDILSSVLDNATQHVIDNLPLDDTSVEFGAYVENLTSLVRLTSLSKPGFVETLLSVIVQNLSSRADALNLAVAVVETTALKPLSINRIIQSIVQHTHFFKACNGTSTESKSIRNAVIALLHHLFRTHPHNTCQVTHIEPLIYVYHGTLSQSDLQILSIFQLFEGQRKLSVVPLLCRWSSSTKTSSQTPLEALQSLDPISVLRTIINFPVWRKLSLDEKSVVAEQSRQDQDSDTLYDPIFIMLMFGHMLVEGPPTSAFGWVGLFRTNVVSLFIRALSAKDGGMRSIAMAQIVGLWKQMESADFHEKPHVVYILNILKDTFEKPDASDISTPTSPRRLPTYSSLILSHALRGVFHPSNFIYPLTSRFLLQRPELDLSDVPMLYNMLYSSTDDWKKERGWIVRFLADGMVGSDDWRVLKRRHTWDLLASMMQSAEEDKALRLGVLEFLANLTCNVYSATSLILKTGLLSWIEMQLQTSATSVTNEAVEWIKILENILVIVDPYKLESATSGEWRSIICRSLARLVDEAKCASASRNFLHAVPVVLRLASLSAPQTGRQQPEELPALLKLATDQLQKLESSVSTAVPETFSSAALKALKDRFVQQPPHRSHTIHQRIQIEDEEVSPTALQPNLVAWGTMLELLWQTCMMTTQTNATWDELTPRLLLWRTLIGEGNTSAGEWARKEVVGNVKQS